MEVEYPILSFACDFDELIALDVEEKGFFDYAVVTLGDGSRYHLHFYDPVRLAVDLKRRQQFGEVCLGEPGLVIVPRVTREYMREAAKQLLKEGYFCRLQTDCRAVKVGRFTGTHFTAIRLTPRPAPRLPAAFQAHETPFRFDPCGKHAINQAVAPPGSCAIPADAPVRPC